MRHIIRVFTLLAAVLPLLATLALFAPARSAEAAGPTVTIELLDPPPGGVITLRAGETTTLDFAVASDTPFTSAMALADPFYPGRGVFLQAADHARRGASAALSLTMTGKSPTSDLPGGYAPVSAVVVVRYPGLPPVVQQYDFQVYVTP